MGFSCCGGNALLIVSGGVGGGGWPMYVVVVELGSLVMLWLAETTEPGRWLGASCQV